ncbi:hypothetical protein [Siccirubricoccus sp. G192]|uniref:hypothetical protein n=1 Tax=Siccirubricoccus sp. G192 TaxID=2849651 RepID=UPI001C2C94A7|nr:hypothetical protein [Siccirubricoccus sp. G192]MBV1800613.1 hypothetical protein [Siccirubricoccus sp. G192]MBV1800677.1 hypothetical protein [Siccirubricoccus sp. G192]
MSGAWEGARRTVHFDAAAERRVLFAVELLDPLTGGTISAGVRVSVRGLADKPLHNLSGRFVFLEEPGAVPGKVRVEILGAPFEPPEEVDAPTPPLADDPPDVVARKRLLRILLHPSPAYVFPPDATVLRGWVTDGEARLPRVLVRASFTDRVAGHLAASPAMTNAQGDFALPLRLSLRERSRGDRVELQLSFTRGTGTDARSRMSGALTVSETGDVSTGNPPKPVEGFDWRQLDAA